VFADKAAVCFKTYYKYIRGETVCGEMLKKVMQTVLTLGRGSGFKTVK
jgi:hypothetical protein